MPNTPAPKPASIPHFGDLLVWAQSRFYALGERTAANGNIYQCVQSGTSSGVGGGPAGGGSGIVDGTAIWAFQVAISTAWLALTNYSAGDVVTNDGGKLYLALNTATSGNAGGPTGTGGAIADGSMVWSYMATAVSQETQPTSRTGDVGFVTGSPFSAGYGNWFDKNVTDWLYYLRDLVSTPGGAFGDGSDGNVVLDGVVAAPAGTTKALTVYTATRDLFFNDLTVTGASVQLAMAGYRLYCRGTLTTAFGGSITADGNDAAGQVAGAFASTGTIGGANGGSTGAAANNNGATPAVALDSYGGGGGQGGNSTGHAGGAGSVATIPVPNEGTPRNYSASTFGFLCGAGGGPVTVYRGGNGGSSGSADAGSLGGGGGGGGGVLAIAARNLFPAAATDLHANGGKGGPGQIGVSAGGGGGGGGGVCVFAYANKTAVNFVPGNNAAGGTGGAGAGAGGTAGGQGTNGSVFDLSLS